MEQLFLARRILGYSYVACFYMFDGTTLADDIPPPQQELLKNLFEDAQAMLEVEVHFCFARMQSFMQHGRDGAPSLSLSLLGVSGTKKHGNTAFLKVRAGLLSMQTLGTPHARGC